MKNTQRSSALCGKGQGADSCNRRCGSNNTAHAIRLSKLAQACGADGLLHVTPYYNKASQKGLYLHFKACADATNLPILLYNVPSRTGVNILPEPAAGFPKFPTS